MSIVKAYNVGGIQVNVYTSPASLSPSVVVVFLLHGRTGDAAGIDKVARTLLEKVNGEKHNRSLCIVTLDHRNHGNRTVNAVSNNSWSDIESNEQHALDMYAIQVGTAKDVSFLMDFLPSYLFPNDEHKIDSWGVAGISLGGHSTWIMLSQEPRVNVGIPIIGCPDYLGVIKPRAKASKIPFAAPYFPASFIKYIGAADPASRNYTSLDASNPFLGKKILVLSGADDTLVPWTASQKFVDALEVGAQGIKKVVLQEGIGHMCTAEMVDQAAEFIGKELCGNIIASAASNLRL